MARLTQGMQRNAFKPVVTKSSVVQLLSRAETEAALRLIGLPDDLDILISRQANDPDSIQGLLNKTGKAIVPSRVFERPHPQSLRWHRENCFKQ